MKLKHTILLALTTVALNAQADGVKPHVKFVSATRDGLTIQFSAGTEGAPNGFELVYRQVDSNNGVCHAAFNCDILGPLESVNELIPATGTCEFTNCPAALPCDSTFEVYGFAINGRQTRTITAMTEPCQGF